MKPSLFLLGTILVSAPHAFGQETPILAPVIATVAMPNYAELQAQIAVAAQALAKLPNDTPGLANAKERVAKADAMVGVPVTFSVGQSSRQAHLVLDNLVSARVWCQTAVLTANAGDKVALDGAIESLQAAEKIAQQKVDVLDKPDTRTEQQIRDDSVRVLKEADAFLEEYKKDSIASDESFQKRRAESAKSQAKFEEMMKLFKALPAPSTPADAQRELEKQKKQEKEFYEVMHSMTPAQEKAFEAENAASENYIEAETNRKNAFKKVADLYVELYEGNLSEAQKQQVKTKIVAAVKEQKGSEKTFKIVSEKLDKLVAERKALRLKDRTPAVEPNPQ